MERVRLSASLIGEDRPLSRGVFAALGLGVVALLAVVSFLPLRDKLALHTKGRFHDAGHLLAFALLALSLLQATRSPRVRWLLLCCVLVFGWGIETAQHLAFREPLERTDVWLDATGAFLGSLIALVVGDKGVGRGSS